MALTRKILWFATGLALATLAAALIGPRPAGAQTLPSILPPKQAPQAAQPRRQPRPADPAEAEEYSGRDTAPAERDRDRAWRDREGDAATTTPAAGTTAAPAGPLLRGATGAPAPLPQEAEDTRDRRSVLQRLPGGLRPALRDGDLSFPPEPPAPRDGAIDVGEPPPAPDGIDPQRVDARPPEEAAPFEGATTPDALLFPVEGVEPLKDRRTERLFRIGPYDPTGIRIGSFVLFPEAELDLAGYSNLFRSVQPKGDAAFEARPLARLVSDWRRHAIELRASGDLTFHNGYPGEDNRFYLLEARGRLDVSRRTNLQALASRQVTQESRSGIDARLFGERADITTDQVIAALHHRFNRLSVQLRGGVKDVSFTATREPDGGLNSNLDRNYSETTETARASWELKPTLHVLGETTLVQRAYAAAPLSDGIRRDSDGERIRVGVSFGETGEILRGEASIGWGNQRPDDRRLRDIDAFLLDASVAWRVTPLTSLLLTASTDIVDTTSAGAAGVVVRSLGAEARHAFRRDLIATAGVQATRSDYQGIVLDQTETAARLGAEYALNREVTIFTRYQHIWFDSSERNADYEADEVRVGVRVRR